MKNLKNISLLLLLLSPITLLAAAADVPLKSISVDVGDRNALQRGAKYFMNYCMGCHSLHYSSYKRLQKDLRLTEVQVLNNLVFTYGDKKALSDYIEVAMSKQQGKAFFGKQPPDLSTISRSRGVDWLNTYLTSFYVDNTRPYGVNNLVFKKVGMPHVMVELQGEQKAIFDIVKDENGHITKKTFKKFELVKPGLLSEKEYEQVVKDLVTFLAYVGEPAKLARHQLGVWVMLFLFVFAILAYLLKKEYWRDVH